MKKVFFLICFFIIYSRLNAQQPPSPPLNPDEHWTNLWSVSYDFQSYGSIRYLVQDPVNPLNWCAILMAQKDSTTPAGTDRYIYYAYSDDDGHTWIDNVIDDSAFHGYYGFPCITLLKGSPVIAAHDVYKGSFVFKDSAFGTSSFSMISGVPQFEGNDPIHPHISGTSNGNLVMVGTVDGPLQAYWTTFNGIAWSPYIIAGNMGGLAGAMEISSGTNGKVAIINGKETFMSLKKSTDNGETFSGTQTIFNNVVDGPDTLDISRAGWGYQSVYDDNEYLHIVFKAVKYREPNAIFSNPYTSAIIKQKIYHWSSATQTYNIIAGKENISNLTDTITQHPAMSLSHPTIARTATGKLVCAFTAFLRGNVQIVQNGDTINAGEIFVSVSSDNGETWSRPQNITNTPNIDEKNPSLPPTLSSDNLRIFYIRDMRAGNWVTRPEWGKAPVYGIFKNVSGLIGISENNHEIKSYELNQNYPNPFNPITKIIFDLPRNTNVKLIVYDMLGKEVKSIVNSKLSMGRHEYDFDGSNFASGVYYYKLISDEFVETKKMILLK